MHNDILKQLKKDLRVYADKDKAKILSGFFKTAPGQYGHGDIFLGVKVPQTRTIVKKYFAKLTLSQIEVLLYSKIHEERLAAVLMLVERYRISEDVVKKEIYTFYIDNAKQINNWDLVDASAEHIVGSFLEKRSKSILTRLAKSDNIWERRIAMIATFHYIKKGECDESLRIATILLSDKHDLIQKAVGWMLREVGKRCGQNYLEEYIGKYYGKISRTTLRYAIERFPEESRKYYLHGMKTI